MQAKPSIKTARLICTMVATLRVETDFSQNASSDIKIFWPDTRDEHACWNDSYVDIRTKYMLNHQVC